ncbi:MATH domain and coiled-coil domain-containing protein [Cardamine amara subsp. amara]|uniref:MATH domain and coiled-coil domain-containing protein n=1 Tax=Cardamine amara subsp. amara TaxID=228776 RepID=A0ABD1AJD3_CARAN
MGKQFNKKITWTIKNFSSLQQEKIYSDHFVVSGSKWHLLAYPKVDDYLSLFLEVADYGSLSPGWRRQAKASLTLVNQRSEKLSQHEELQISWFELKSPGWGRNSMFPLNKINAKDSGFLLNGELKIVAEVDVLEVIGKFEEISTILETMDVNGFQLHPSQAKSVSLMFERHSEIASEFRPKNPNLRNGYMNFLLGLIGTMCQSPQEISKDDLSEAYAALGSMINAGFKLDWLEKKLDEVVEKKEKEQVGETTLQGMEEELKDLKKKCSDMEALVEKERGQVSAATANLSFDDIV